MMEINSLLEQALETFPNFVLVDADGFVVYITKAYASLLGIEQEKVIGNPVTEVIPNTRIDVILKTGKEEIGSLITLFDHSKQEEITVVCNRIPIKKDNKVIGAIAITTMSELSEVANLYNEMEQIRKENTRYRAELEFLKRTYSALDRIIGHSSSIKEIKKIIQDFAQSNLTVLITGETGVGKEVFANALHQLSNRASENYVKINCAAIPKDLLESELFGYTEGAFSGAVKGGKIGKFESAQNGTLLLDEIGEMPLALQAKLLRAIQEKEIERIGSVKPLKLNVRILCSTNQNLEILVQQGSFREDLYYRINTIELPIPPLRDRMQDIPLLCQFFIDKICEENNYQIKGITPDVLDLFSKYQWPGNVRELEHVIERLAVLARNSMIQLEHCSFLMKKIEHNKHSKEERATGTLHTQRDIAEQQAIQNALTQTGGNKTKAALLLNIDRSMLYHKLKKYNMI